MIRHYLPSRQTLTERRGQAFTMEAVFAAILLLAAVLFALQTTAITPLTGSTTSQQVQNQQSAVAEGVLASAAEQGMLKEAALHYDIEADNWHGLGPGESAYATTDSDHDRGPPEALRLANRLDRAYSDGVATNVNMHYFTAPTDRGQGDQHHKTETLVDMGTPSSNAVTATRTIVLYTDDVPLEADGDPYEDATGSQITLEDVHDDASLDFYAEYVAQDSAGGISKSPINEGSPVYNVVTVEVVVWRI